MFRNEYDRDVSIWSPQGRIHQIEYAMEAVKQGSATVGLKSRTHAVIVALKRSQSELTAHQRKLIKISPHIAVGISGLTADGRSLGNFMQTECMYHEYVYDCRVPVSRLVSMVASKTQQPTMFAGLRPFGVGILLAGYDEKGPHIYQTCPSANFYNCKAMAIGSRSQSARTYLERQIEKFADCTLEELIRHGLLALRETLPSGQDLNEANCSVAVVGVGCDVVIYEDEKVGRFVQGIDAKPDRNAAVVPAPRPAAMGEAQQPRVIPPISAGGQEDDEQPMET